METVTSAEVVADFQRKLATAVQAETALRAILHQHPGPWTAAELEQKALAEGGLSSSAVRSAMLELQARSVLVRTEDFTLSSYAVVDGEY